MMELKLASRSQVAMVYGRDLKPSFPPGGAEAPGQYPGHVPGRLLPALVPL